MELIKEFNEWFWDESFWLPINNTWKDLKRTDEMYIPAPADLFLTLPVAVCLLCVRYLWERYIAFPIGVRYKLKSYHSRLPFQSSILDDAFKKSPKFLTATTVKNLSKETGKSIREVERWWKRKRVSMKPTQMVRFQETSWRFLFYFAIFWYGLFVLSREDWFYDTKACWYAYPRQDVHFYIQWYYYLEISFYISLCLSLLTDVKRKDFSMMIVHHVATLILMGCSWSNNMVRVGTLVVLIHDAVDFWLEGAKMANYIGKKNLSNTMFIIFTVDWFITRFIIFPFWVLNSTLFEGKEIIGWFPIYYWFNTLLLTLQVLHVIWFAMILRMMYYYLILGKELKDDRSDSEESDNDNDNYNNNVHQKKHR